MTTEEARHFILPAVEGRQGVWADIGAGTGIFTRALMSILHTGVIYAVDKNPHVLYQSFSHHKTEDGVTVEVREADFHRPLDLPALDGILMANALHYSPDPLATLQNVLIALKPGGQFLLIEYATDQSRSPWVPYPVPFEKFSFLCSHVGLSDPIQVNRMPSAYGYSHIYLALAQRLESYPG